MIEECVPGNFGEIINNTLTSFTKKIVVEYLHRSESILCGLITQASSRFAAKQAAPCIAWRHRP